MLNTINRLTGAAIIAADGKAGRLKEVYFEDKRWTIRHLVVETRTEAGRGRQVLIRPEDVTHPLDDARNIGVSLTRQQIERSPGVDRHRPVTLRHEQELVRERAAYWTGNRSSAPSAFRRVLSPGRRPAPAQVAVEDREVLSEDKSLRSSATVLGYDIVHGDDRIGHVNDFLVDDASWSIRDLVVDTRSWLPGGKKVLLATKSIEAMDWVDRVVYTRATRAQIANSPEYEAAESVAPDRAMRPTPV